MYMCHWKQYLVMLNNFRGLKYFKAVFSFWIAILPAGISSAFFAPSLLAIEKEICIKTPASIY